MEARAIAPVISGITIAGARSHSFDSVHRSRKA
jgi:hypothetical protein